MTPSAPPHPLANAQGGGHKILIVESDPAQLAQLQLALHEHNYHCAVFGSAEAALESCEPSLLAAAILGLKLGGADGIELGRRLKEMAGRDIFLPVIVVSNSDVVEDRVRGFRHGCDDFLCTPVHHFELCVRLASLIARREQHVELLRANAALQRAQQRRSELSALMVHDLKNPLSAIMGNVQLMAESCPPGDELMNQCLADVKVLSIRALSLVDGLLDVEELEDGLLKAERVEIDLNEFVGGFPSFYEAATSARKLSLEIIVAPGLRARFDRQLIGRILENLLDNGVRYAKRGGRVRLEAFGAGSDLIIEIGNTGPAVPDGERARIFERYYRVDANSPGAASRGLGLYFCRLAAEAHDGQISVQSREDFPTCFVLRLPGALVVAAVAG